MPEPAIEVRALTKTFERRPERGIRAWRPGRKRELITALDNVDLTVQRGELFGLLGPNAAGKTTLVKVLATLLLPTSGSGTVSGLDLEKDADAVRRKVGVVLGGDRALYWRLTARENLWYFSQLYDMPEGPARERIQQLLGIVGLQDRADERVENYSKGMKQRLHIARGLLHDPEILLLDEPTIGLDPHAARALRALVRDLVRVHRRTVLLTTHYMYEADELSDRVAILHHGKIVACDTPAALKAQAPGTEGVYRVTVRAEGAAKVRDALAERVGAHVLEQAARDGAVTLRVPAGEARAGQLARAVEEAGGELLALARDERTLEDAFVALTGEGLGAAGAAGEEAKR